MDFLPDVIGGDEPEEVVIQEAVKPKLTEEGVFDDDARGEPMKMKEVVQPIEEESVNEDTGEVNPNFVYEEPAPEPKPEPVKKTRKKRVMTEEQKQKLAEARKKALAVRRANAKKKQEIKDLKKMKEDKELDDLRNSVGVTHESLPAPVEPKPAKPKPKPPPEPTPVQNKQYKYTEEDLQTFSLKAIQDYDTLRKSRKIVKQKQKQEESYKEKERQKLLRVVSNKPAYNSSDDYWGNCF